MCENGKYLEPRSTSAFDRRSGGGGNAGDVRGGEKYDLLYDPTVIILVIQS